MLIFAHAGHWLVSGAYFVPVAGFLIWLTVTTLRERRSGGRKSNERRSRPR